MLNVQIIFHILIVLRPRYTAETEMKCKQFLLSPVSDFSYFISKCSEEKKSFRETQIHRVCWPEGNISSTFVKNTSHFILLSPYQ